VYDEKHALGVIVDLLALATSQTCSVFFEFLEPPPLGALKPSLARDSSVEALGFWGRKSLADDVSACEYLGTALPESDFSVAVAQKVQSALRTAGAHDVYDCDAV